MLDGAFIKPLPAPCFIGVAVLPSAISPTTGSKETLGFLARRSPLGADFLLIDGLIATVAEEATSPDSFFLVACALINAFLLASSISVKLNG